MDAVIVMGVSGCGKSTVGELLAKKLGCKFFDGDDYHPAENKAKMAAGNPLNDGDRAGWLDTLCGLIKEHDCSVIACSALKKAYRDKLRSAGKSVCFVHLDGSREMLAERLQDRAKNTDHFMNPALLDSQLDTLEDPNGEPLTLVLDIATSADLLVGSAQVFLKLVTK